MKTKEEIAKLSEVYSAEHMQIAFRKGYTQGQENAEQEINRLKKIMIESSHQAMTWEEKYWQLKNSLNKQD